MNRTHSLSKIRAAIASRRPPFGNRDYFLMRCATCQENHAVEISDPSEIEERIREYGHQGHDVEIDDSM